MRALAPTFALGTAIGCTEKDREIPMYEDGILVEGDCDEAVDIDAASRSTLFSGEDPLIKLDGLSGYSRILPTQQAYRDFMISVNFGSWVEPADFSTHQGAATWLQITDGCGFSVEETHINRKADGNYVLDVLFFDGALNCETGCGNDYNALVVEMVPAGDNITVCRRIRPGCPPE